MCLVFESRVLRVFSYLINNRCKGRNAYCMLVEGLLFLLA